MLPKTPTKGAAVLTAYIDSRRQSTSPAVERFHASLENSLEKDALKTFQLDTVLQFMIFRKIINVPKKNEIQSSYFQKIEVSIHVSIIHRHALLEYDGVDSTDEHPHIVTEQFLVISPDSTHDHHFTSEVQQLVAEYLKSISCPVTTMHEFTDGCSSQYKSRHCLGDVSHLGYNLLIRNYRGPQDAAGGYVKIHTDIAVLRGSHIVQNARDVYEFAKDNLNQTSDKAKCARRVVTYLETINRDRDRRFRPVKYNRKSIKPNRTKMAN